jgi:stage IV sporulation protein FB
MLRFSLFGIPVTIQWMFWVVLAVLGPINALGRPNALMNLGLWVAVGFVSILWHELGHCFFQRKFGASPEIVLYGGGGVAIPHGARFTRGQSLIIAGAGPAFGLALWLATALLIQHFPPQTVTMYRVARYVAWINLVWSLVNLLPVLPLDGGRIMEALLNGRIRVVAAIGAAVAVLAAVASFLIGQLYMAIFFGFFAWQNVQLWQTGSRAGPV